MMHGQKKHQNIETWFP